MALSRTKQPVVGAYQATNPRTFRNRTSIGRVPRGENRISKGNGSIEEGIRTSKGF